MKLFFRIACLALLVSGTLAQGFDLSDALGDDTPTDPPKKKDDGGLNILDAFGDDEPYKPDVNPPKPPSGGGGGGSFDDSLHDLAGGGGGGGSYDPHGDRYGGRGGDPGYDTNSGGNQPTQDGEFEWGHILKMLNANMPEDFFMWMSNAKQMMAPLLERVLDLLNAVPGDEQQEL